MKYMLSTYGSAEQDFGISGWSNDEMTAMVGFMQKIDEELRESGELVDEEGLTDASHAKVIEVRDGVPVVTDGPYADTKEVLAGYWVVDCESVDRALAIAARIATVPMPSHVPAVRIEVRPIAEEPPNPEG
ncbi:MAG TPA: YciI family protein [Jiangellaceae bacterium]|jgi:hypothetical protein|nr:YciI family protein [Jiangellaceae bacterium]